MPVSYTHLDVYKRQLLPFAAMQNVALRVYSGDLAGEALQRAVFLQIFWFFAMLACGKALEYRAMKKIVVQGGLSLIHIYLPP